MTKDAEHPLSELISIAAKAGLGLLPGGGLLTADYEGLQLLRRCTKSNVVDTAASKPT